MGSPSAIICGKRFSMFVVLFTVSYRNKQCEKQIIIKFSLFPGVYKVYPVMTFVCVVAYGEIMVNVTELISFPLAIEGCRTHVSSNT
jgi:hypothetical protein